MVTFNYEAILWINGEMSKQAGRVHSDIDDRLGPMWRDKRIQMIDTTGLLRKLLGVRLQQITVLKLTVEKREKDDTIN